VCDRILKRSNKVANYVCDSRVFVIGLLAISFRADFARSAPSQGDRCVRPCAQTHCTGLKGSGASQTSRK